MLEKLDALDKKLLLFFNHLNNSFFDFIFYWASDKFIWIPFYLLLFWFIIKKYKINTVWVMLCVALAITLSDQIASTIIKQSVMRLRPCHDPEIMDQVHIVYGYCGGKFGFISSHAANTFTLAAFLVRIIPGSFRGFKTIIWTWACFVSFSRIYLGVHYPGDILVAAILGILLGTIISRLLELIIRKYSLIKNQV